MKNFGQALRFGGRPQATRKGGATGVCCLAALPLGGSVAWSTQDIAALCADRADIERVYYNHRTGSKPSFEQTLPADQVRQLVQRDLAKEAALRQVYGVEVTPARVEAELRRIHANTRAPEILAELKAALGNDTNRFARTVAKPIIVERLLRNRFENDDALHAAQRREAETIRNELLAAKPPAPVAAARQSAAIATETNGDPGESELAALCRAAATLKQLAETRVALLQHRHSNEVSQATWQLGARPPETNTPTADEIEIRNRFGPNARLLSPPSSGERDRPYHFEDLPGELHRVLRVQLRQPGDVSAVIETPGGFLLYVCKERTTETLSVAMLSLPKRSYEEWAAERNGEEK